MSPVPRASRNVTSQEKKKKQDIPSLSLVQRKPHRSIGSSVYLPVHRFNSGNVMRSLMIHSYNRHFWMAITTVSHQRAKIFIQHIQFLQATKNLTLLNQGSAKCPFLSKRHLVTPALMKIPPLHIAKGEVQ